MENNDRFASANSKRDGKAGRERKTLSVQTYEFLKERILHGVYRSGQKMPSLRETAEVLCVSRNTAERAYEQLLAEGYLTCKRKSGYFVEDFDIESIAPSKSAPVPAARPAATRDKPGGNAPFDYDFTYADPDPAAFPLTTWRKLANAALSSDDALAHNRYCEPLGNEALRREIARYVFDSRGVVCQPDQVIVQAGFSDGLDRLLKLFDPAKHAVAIEDPCLHIARDTFLDNRFVAHGVDASSPERFCAGLAQTNAQLMYVTPSHQFPTGSTMSLATRTALLDWAETHDAFLVEDDYDSEFRYRTKSIPPLHALDGGRRVMYAGSFSKTLSPSLRISFWVLPPALLDAYREKLGMLQSAVPWLTQRVLSDFLEQGHWARHLRKYVTLNRKKRRALLDACQDVFEGRMKLDGVDAGLHVWAHLEGCDDAAALIEAARNVGVALYSPRPFYYDPARVDAAAFMMGHARIAEADIRPGIVRLREAWESLA